MGESLESFDIFFFFDRELLLAILFLSLLFVMDYVGRE